MATEIMRIKKQNNDDIFTKIKWRIKTKLY